MMMMMIMMIVDLYSALRRAPLLRYVSRCIVKRTIFSADRKDPILSDGSRRWSGSRFQTIGPATLECPTSEPTATMTWYDQLMASGRSETSTYSYCRDLQCTLANCSTQQRQWPRSLRVPNTVRETTIHLFWANRIITITQSQSQSQWGICIAPITKLNSGAEHEKN